MMGPSSSQRTSKPCPLCGTRNPIEATTCASCGAKLRRRADEEAGRTIAPGIVINPPTFQRRRSAEPSPVEEQEEETGSLRRNLDPRPPVLDEEHWPGKTVQVPSPRYPGDAADDEPTGRIPPAFPWDREDTGQFPGLAPPPESRPRLGTRALYKRPKPPPLVIKRQNPWPWIGLWCGIVLAIALTLYFTIGRLASIAHVTVDNGLNLPVVISSEKLPTTMTVTPLEAKQVDIPHETCVFNVATQGGAHLEESQLELPSPPPFEEAHWIYNVGRANVYALYVASPSGTLRNTQVLPTDTPRFFRNPATVGPGQPIKVRGAIIGEVEVTVLGHYPLHKSGTCCQYLREFKLTK